ncbi:MAG: biopolymer transporter ExbD, partial [Myxococcota bacterium]
RASYDVEVFVRADGNLFLGDRLVLLAELDAALRDAVAADPTLRVVVAAETGAPYDAVVGVVTAARALGAERVALSVDDLDGVPRTDDPLFTGPDDAVVLDAIDADRAELRPRRHRFPQDPYANANSFTAYTLQFGETKIGLGSVAVGVAPRLQVGTVPALDLLGGFNLNAKANLVREGPVDAAILAQYYYAPLTKILSSSSADLWFPGDETTIAVSYLGLGATTSVQLADPWSAHLQLYWARPSATGDIAFDDLPSVLLPGLSLGETASLGLGVSGDLAVVNLATDLRFNRRDSVFAWLRYPFYGKVRGRTTGEIDGFDALSNAEFIVAYGDFVPFADSYSVAIGYQASWRHVEARAGVGWSAVPGAWLLQAFELSYRFGGATRREERKIHQGYRQDAL